MCESLPGSPLLTRKVSPVNNRDEVKGNGPQISAVRATATQRWTRLLQKARRAGQSGVSLVTPLDRSYHVKKLETEQDPEAYIQLIQSGPYVQSYTWLKKQLTNCDSRWMLRFLELDGLGILYSALQKLTERSRSSIAHAYAQVECVACFKAVMNSQTGLDYIIDDTEFIRKLATALDTSNATVKKQVFELLSALCMYSSEGYARAIDALDHYKTSQNQRYRFSLIIEELRKADATSYKTTLAAFINCVLIATESLEERVRLRNELVGLKLLDILTSLRKECSDDPDLVVQLDVFDDNKVADEEQFSGPHGVDLNNAIDVFHAIFKQVCDTPQITPFLTILQHLLRIDTKEPISDVVWEVAEKLVHKSILLDKKEHRERLLKLGERELIKAVTNFQSPSAGKENESKDSSATPSPRERARSLLVGDVLGDNSAIRTTGMGIADALIISPSTTSDEAYARDFGEKLCDRSLASSSPPPPPAHGGEPPPSPPPGMMPPSPPCPPPPCPPPPPGMGPPPPPGMGPPPPPGMGPPPPPGMGPPPPPGGLPSMTVVHRPNVIPSVTPKTKMRTLNWSKLPPHKVMNENSIWRKVNQIENGFNADWQNLEELFCQQNLMKQKRKDGKEEEVKKKRESTEINILDGKKSLHVNIFLKQFRSTNAVITRLLEDGKSAEIGAEKLKSLLKIMPESDEVDMLSSFDGDRNKLGQAEKFYIMLIDIPFYKIRVESMLLKEEFTSDIEYLIPSIESIIIACQEILDSKSLKEILFLVLLTGNFLNAGGYAGNAMGFKVASLLKLVETRANKPRMNLLHCVAEMAESKNKKLLDFPSELTHLEEGSKFSVEQLTSDINSLEERVNTIESQLGQLVIDETHSGVRRYIQSIIKMSREDLGELREMMTFVNEMKVKLAVFFCDEAHTFSLEECIMTFKIFCEKFKKAVEENEQRRVQEQKAEQKRQQREEQKRLKEGRRSSLRSSSSTQSNSNSGGRIVDNLLGKIRDGFSSRKSPDTVGVDTIDSDYESRPTSPGPEDDIGSGLTRGTPMRKSWQKFEQLNSITENGSENRPVGSGENDDNKSTSSGVSSQGTWGSTGSRDDSSPSNTMNSSAKKVRSQQRPRSADDDSLFDMLLQGNDEEALEKFEYFKREGSLRRSGRRSLRRYADPASGDNRERTDSPTSSPMITRRNSLNSDQVGRVALSPIEITSSSIKPASSGIQRHRSVLNSPEDKIALETMARRERQKQSMGDATISASPKESSNDLTVGGLRRSRSDSGPFNEIRRAKVNDTTNAFDSTCMHKKDRIESFSDMDTQEALQLNVDAENSCTSSLIRGDSLETLATSTKRNMYAATSPKTRHQGNGRTNSAEIDSALDSLGSAEDSTNDRSSVTQNKVPGAVKEEEVSVEEKVTNWQNQLQHMDVEAALNTVETTLVDKERKNRELIEKSMDETPTQNSLRTRYRRWRTVGGELDTANSRAERTEKRKDKDTYEDHETRVFLDRPINAHLALEGMSTDSLAQAYREKITQDRRAIEQIMAVGPARDVERPRGLKAIQLQRTMSAPTKFNCVSNDNDPWASIDMQQMTIRRDIIDMKIRATTPERESIPNTDEISVQSQKCSQANASQNSNTNLLESNNTIYQLADDDVYILREKNTKKHGGGTSHVSAKMSLANNPAANYSVNSSSVGDINENIIPLSNRPQKNGTKKTSKFTSPTEPIKSSNGPEIRKPRDLKTLAKPGIAKSSRLERPTSLSKNTGASPRSTEISLFRQSGGLSKNPTQRNMNRTIENTKKISRQRTDSGGSVSSEARSEGRRRSESTSSSMSSVSSTGPTGNARTPRTTNTKPRADSGSSTASRSSVNSERKLQISTPKSGITSIKSSSLITSLPKPTATKLKPTPGKPITMITQNKSSRSQTFSRNALERKTIPPRSTSTSNISNRTGTARSSARSIPRLVERKQLSNVVSTSSPQGNRKLKKSMTAPNLQTPGSLALNRANRSTCKTVRQQLREDAVAKTKLKDIDADDSSMSSVGDMLDKEKNEKKRTKPSSQNSASLNSSKPTLTRNVSVRRSTRSSSASPKVPVSDRVGKSSPKTTPKSHIVRTGMKTHVKLSATSTSPNSRLRKTDVVNHNRDNTNNLDNSTDVPGGDIQYTSDDESFKDITDTNVKPQLDITSNSDRMYSETNIRMERSTSDPDLLKSARSASDSNLQREPDIKCSLQRASTMSLPPDARKRGPPDSLKSARTKPSRLSKLIHRLSRKSEKRPDSIAETFEELSADFIAKNKPTSENKRKEQNMPVATKTRPVYVKNVKASNMTAPTASSLRRTKSATASTKTGQQHAFRPKFGFGSGRFEKSPGSASGK